MDFNFMRASSTEYKKQQGRSRVVRSRQGYTATLTIIDCATRRLFAFPTQGKSLPILIVDAFLAHYGLEGKGLKAVRTDQGGELACLTAFQEVIAKHHYVLEPTGSDTPSENGLAERPNGTLSTMFCRLLYTSGLLPTFWADALLHSVYLYNRLVHTSIGMTPLEAHTGVQSDLS